MKLAFESNIDGYLYVAQQGTSGNWTVLFPNPDINGGRNTIAPLHEYEVPGDGDMVRSTATSAPRRCSCSSAASRSASCLGSAPGPQSRDPDRRGRYRAPAEHPVARSDFREGQVDRRQAGRQAGDLCGQQRRSRQGGGRELLADPPMIRLLFVLLASAGLAAQTQTPASPQGQTPRDLILAPAQAAAGSRRRAARVRVDRRRRAVPESRPPTSSCSFPRAMPKRCIACSSTTRAARFLPRT